ncbi:uncharacterized protein CTRU02_209386 [Colletotrichum truncatum]|uniref:Uncharacterized protein n=1 Tax=Colletotrichum truncatum TaxID=5467 RepID=A0ACC3YS89_COLTU|nr:uncharacterized protein CTRU02_08537 [Colletotrichum truncatum]KAF6789838.1 hypothetical protein CTRU02_08537 [Colletotrichum truncatum]
MRSLTSANNTPSGCNNLSTAAVAHSNDPTSSPAPQHHHHRHHLQKKPDSSRLNRNIRPSSLSPATRNPATASSSHPTSSSPLSTPLRPSAVNRKPSVAQLRARTTNNPASTPTKTTPAASAASGAATPLTTTTTTTTTGPPTTTGPRRITATTTTIGRSATKTSSSTSSTNTPAATNPNTTSSSPTPFSTTTTTPSTASSTTTSSRRQPPALSSSLRTPLRSRDQNVLSPSRPANAARAKPSPTPSPTPSASSSAESTPNTMPPYDKGGSTTTRQPGMPSLTAKGMNRTPLTPKVAAKQPPVVTPLGRRRNDNPNNNNHHPTLNSNAGNGAKDDLTSPAPFLSNNITPRSGSRQSRVDSNNSTPNGTPNPDRNVDWDHHHQPTFQGEPVRRQVVTFSPASNVGSRNDATESKFFYASDAKSSAPAPQPKTVVAAPQRGSNFMYANGSAVGRNSRPTSPGVGVKPMLAPSLAPSLAPTPEPQQSKFFYANGAPNLQPGFRPSSAASGAGSTTTSDSRKLARTSGGSAGAFTMAQRPLSPNKPPTSVPLVKSNSQTRSQVTSPPPLAPSTHKRKISMDSVSQVASHVGSEAPTDAMIMSRFMASQSPTPSEMPSPTMPSFFPNQPITIASILQAADDLEESDDESKDMEELHSPTKSTHGDPLNDMVVNARRERKVQDLEITNASLEAINRSLERQLRKQTAELRRYKRLSRSGRLSMPSAAPSRVPSDSTTGGLGIEGLDLSDLSEEEVEDELEDLDDSMFESSELSDADSGAMASPKSNPDRDARRRKRDEKRLQLDLTKHRELLVDSQKINQSIKKCLNWTEELIKEGKKALEYNVRPSDVELPPRVLQPLYLREDDVDDKERKGETSIPSSPLESPKSLTQHWSKELQDRDSGIELPADGG